MSADLTVRLHDPGRGEPPEDWSEYHRRDAHHPLWSWPVVRALQVAHGDPILAATLHDDDQVAGVAVGRVRGLGARWRRPVATVADLSCPGSSAQPGIRLLGVDPGISSAPEHRARFAAAVEALEAALLRDWPGRIDLVWHRQTFAELLPAVQRGLSFTYPGAPAAMLRRGFDSWEAYLATLSRSRRNSVRRVTRQLGGDPDLDIAFRPGIVGLDTDEVVRLMHGTAARHHTRRFPPMPFWPRALLDALFDQDGVTTLRYHRGNGQLLAAGVLFEHPDVPVHGHWGALDRDRGAPSGLWVDQMARVLRRNIESGARGVVGGKGLTDLKADFGFDVVPQWSVVRRLSRRRVAVTVPSGAAAARR